MTQHWKCAVLLLALGSAASAQQRPRRFELGLQSTGIEALGQTSWCAACLKAYWSAGPAASFNLNEHFAIDGAVTVFKGQSGNTSGYVGGHLTTAVAGLKGSLRGDRFAMFAKLCPGIVRWSQGQMSDIQLSPNGTLAYSYVPRTNFGVDFGVGLEYSVTPRIAVRTDLGTLATVWHRNESNRFDLPYDLGSPTSTHFSAGMFYRFGAPIAVVRSATDVSHKFFDKTNLALFSAHLLAYSAGAITTQRGFANCRKNSPRPNDPHYGCAQIEGNSLARPLVSRGWGGQIAFTTIANGAMVLTSFGLHRIGHHRIERVVPALNTAGEAFAAYGNLQ